MRVGTGERVLESLTRKERLEGGSRELAPPVGADELSLKPSLGFGVDDIVPQCSRDQTAGLVLKTGYRVSASVVVVYRQDVPFAVDTRCLSRSE